MKTSTDSFYADGDRIALAFEREHKLHEARPRPMAHECVFNHTFQCVCCLRRRPDEDRQSPDSEVCVHCVHAAGIETAE